MSVKRSIAIGEPASDARLTFADNCDDIRSYYTVHWSLKDLSRGLRSHLSVFDKSMYVLVSALWEAYIEDVAAEALSLLAAKCDSPDRLPVSLRKEISRVLRDDKHELAAWSLAGDGWRQLVTDRLDSYRGKREWTFNTPKSAQIDSFFREVVGLPNLSRGWTLDDMPATTVATLLDLYLTTRGEIAHRPRRDTQIRKRQVKDFFNLVNRLVPLVDAQVAAFLHRAIDMPGWWSEVTLTPAASKPTLIPSDATATTDPSAPVTDR